MIGEFLRLVHVVHNRHHDLLGCCRTRGDGSCSSTRVRVIDDAGARLGEARSERRQLRLNAQ
jgi:hypothetical protein